MFLQAILKYNFLHLQVLVIKYIMCLQLVLMNCAYKHYLWITLRQKKVCVSINPTNLKNFIASEIFLLNIKCTLCTLELYKPELSIILSLNAMTIWKFVFRLSKKKKNAYRPTLLDLGCYRKHALFCLA